MIGQTISHYRILEKLGGGGMGTVYKAEDVRLKRIVALKFLSPDLTRDDVAKSRFVREAQAASALQHPNICNIHDIEETSDNRLFIVMDCYDGEPLNKLIDRGPLPIDTAIDIAGQVAQGLRKAHEGGIVHRDIKPANIMVGSDGIPRIVDFGLAKLSGRSLLTKSGSTLGTAAYMSPEQARGDEVGYQSDIWSLGVVLYEMITGKRPFESEYEQALIYSILNEDPKPMREHRPEVPEAIESICRRAMARESKDRYQTVSEFIADLESYASGTQLSRETGRIPSKHRRLLYRGIAAVLAVTLAAGYWAWKSPGKVHAFENSIAILYLKNLGPETDEPYSYGITQDLIVDVAKAGLVRVAPMNDVLTVQNATLPIENIAERLRVRYVLDGTLKREGDQFRLTAQIIEASTGKTIWADHIQSKAAGLQGELAEAIIGALHLNPSAVVERGITAARVVDPRAYEFYLRAKYVFAKRQSKSDVAVARGLFEKSIGLDSTFILPLLGIGETFEHEANYERAQSIYEHALHAARNKGDSLEEANCHLSLGSVRWKNSDYAEAREHLTASLQMFEELDDRNGIGVSLTRIGNVYLSQNKFVEAHQFYQRALAIKEELDDPSGKGLLLNNLGVLYDTQGDYAKALEYYEESLVICRLSENKVDEGNAVNNIGAVYFTLGDYAKASDYFLQSLTICQTLGDRRGEMQSLINMGSLYGMLNEDQQSLAYLDRGLKMSRESDDLFLEALTLQTLGQAELRSGDYAKAVRYLQDAVDKYRHVGEQQSAMTAMSWLAFGEVNAGLRSPAIRHSRQVEEWLKSSSISPQLIEVWWNLSRINARIGDVAAAGKYCEMAYQEVQSCAAKISDRDLRERYLTSVQSHRDIIAQWQAGQNKRGQVQ